MGYLQYILDRGRTSAKKLMLCICLSLLFCPTVNRISYLVLGEFYMKFLRALISGKEASD